MIYYHGTTLDAAKKIKQDGLIPHRETAYQLKDEDGDYLRHLYGEDKPYIYLQTNKFIAEGYAQFRARYERAKKGQKITVGNLLSEMWKVTDKVDPYAKPALVTVDVPLSLANQFMVDPQNSDGGKVCLCTVPPQYVRSVAEVH